MVSEKQVQLKYKINLPDDYTFSDFENAIFEFAEKEEETKKYFNKDAIEIVKLHIEQVDVGALLTTVVIAFAADVIGDLSKDAAKKLLTDLFKRKILPYLKNRFGRSVAENEEG